MTRINTNIASLRGLRSLNKAGNLLDQSLTRLSTGLKINSGKDNPAGLIASESLRTQVTSIEQSIKNSGRANNVIATADSALGEVNNLLNQVRGLVQESLNNGALSRSEIEANQNQIDAALDAINRISANTTFAGGKLIDGSKSFVTQITGVDSAKLSDFKVNTALFSNSSTIEVNAEIANAAKKGELRYTGADLTQAATLEISGSKGSQVVFLGSSSSKADIRDAVNSISDVTGVKASFTAGATFSLGETQGFTDLASTGVKSSKSYTSTGVKSTGAIDGDGGSSDQLLFQAVTAGTAGNALNVTFVNGGNSQSLAVTVTGNNITVNLGTDSAGTVTSSLTAIKSAINGSTTAAGLVAVTISGSGATLATATSATTLTGGLEAAVGTLSFEADNSGFAGNKIRVAYALASTTSASTSAAVSTGSGGTSTINVTLAKNKFGTSIATLGNIKSAIEAVTAAANLVNVTLTGTTASRGTTLAATAFTGGQDAGFLKVTDNRNSGSGGSVATLGGEVFVQVGDFATETSVASLGINDFDIDSETGNITVKIQLGKNTSGITSTITQVKNYINTSTTDVIVNGTAVDLETYITASTSASTTTGSSKLGSSGSLTQLLGGSDGNNNDIIFNDSRAYGTAGNVKVKFNNPGTVSQSLSITVADVSGSDDKTININLATDANGNVTTTADDLKNLLETGTTAGAIAARNIVSIEVEGDGSELIREAASSSYTTVDVASRILKLQSSEYGSDQFVQLNVLSGSFNTVDDDNVSVKSRDVGSDIEVVINGQQASAKGLEASIRTATLEASLTFNGTNNVDGRRASFTVTGGGALFQIGQEVSAAGQIGIGIEAINTARLGGVTGKLYEIGTGGGKSLLDISPSTPGSDLVGIIEESINRVTNLRGRLGAIQKNVIETNINSLGVALENISEARSVITDTDFAETTADMTKAQILNQAGISVLSIANQNPQQVLSLLG